MCFQEVWENCVFTLQSFLHQVLATSVYSTKWWLAESISLPFVQDNREQPERQVGHQTICIQFCIQEPDPKLWRGHQHA